MADGVDTNCTRRNHVIPWVARTIPIFSQDFTIDGKSVDDVDPDDYKHVLRDKLLYAHRESFFREWYTLVPVHVSIHFVKLLVPA